MSDGTWCPACRIRHPADNPPCSALTAARRDFRGLTAMGAPFGMPEQIDSALDSRSRNSRILLPLRNNSDSARVRLDRIADLYAHLWGEFLGLNREHRRAPVGDSGGYYGDVSLSDGLDYERRAPQAKWRMPQEWEWVRFYRARRHWHTDEKKRRARDVSTETPVETKTNADGTDRHTHIQLQARGMRYADPVRQLEHSERILMLRTLRVAGSLTPSQRTSLRNVLARRMAALVAVSPHGALLEKLPENSALLARLFFRTDKSAADVLDIQARTLRNRIAQEVAQLLAALSIRDESSPAEQALSTALVELRNDGRAVTGKIQRPAISKEARKALNRAPELWWRSVHERGDLQAYHAAPFDPPRSSDPPPARPDERFCGVVGAAPRVKHILDDFTAERRVLAIGKAYRRRAVELLDLKFANFPECLGNADAFAREALKDIEGKEHIAAFSTTPLVDAHTFRFTERDNAPADWCVDPRNLAEKARRAPRLPATASAEERIADYLKRVPKSIARP